MSIELTDDIRNAVFTSPMNSEDMKHYPEYLALAVLKYCFDDYDSLYVKEAPDIQSLDHSIGLEVTEVAVSKNKAIKGDYLQYIKTKDPKYLTKIKEKGGTITDFSYSVLPVTKNDELDAMKNIFQKKLQKKNDYKSKGFKSIGLIMVMTEIPVPNTALEWGKMIYTINSSSKEKFDMIFFIYSCALSILDCSTGEVSFKPIDSNDYDSLMKYATIMAEKKK